MKKIVIFLIVLFLGINFIYAENNIEQDLSIENNISETSTGIPENVEIPVSHLDDKNRTQYIYYYGIGCSHCMKVEAYFEKNDIYNNFDIVKKEVWENRENALELNEISNELGIEMVGTPFLLVKSQNGDSALVGATEIYNYFDSFLSDKSDLEIDNDNDITSLNISKNSEKTEEKDLNNNLNFLFALVPAALVDSINPCAFAVMFILLSSILRQNKSRRKVLLSGFMFILSIFISYIAIGKGLYNAFVSTTNTNILKMGAGILGIFIGLANLKDYFWYGKYFRMEVPTSWRPKMKKLVKSITSPIGAFLMGFVISLFLLPCTSGPYIAILGYLSGNTEVSIFWADIYLIIYNLIFILPMVVITIIVAFGMRNVGELKEYKELNVEKLHLITGMIMLLLGIYILYDVLSLYV